MGARCSRLAGERQERLRKKKNLGKARAALDDLARKSLEC